MFKRPGHFHCAALLALSAGFLSAPAMSEEWATIKWRVICHDPIDCAPADEVYEHSLEEGSKWLSGLGFKEPSVATIIEDDVRWVATVSDSEQREGTLGIYNPSIRALFMRGDAFFTMGEEGESHSDSRYQARAGYMFVPIHEMFHAIQKTYAVDTGYQLSSNMNWLIEGGASAAHMAYARGFAPGAEARARSRRYDAPLHLPDNQADEYGTFYFWLKLGELIGSPHRFAYMTEILTEDLSDHNGLEGVDKGMAPLGGLYEMLPKVFASFGHPYFNNYTRGELDLPRGQSILERSFEGTVEKVAGRKAEIKLKKHTDKLVMAEVWFEEPDADLHLIVDGTLYNEGEGSRRNRYQTIMTEATTELDIIVANVAPKASDSKPKDYTLKVRLMEMKPCEPAVMMSAMDDGAPVVREAGVYMRDFAPGGNRTVHNALMPNVGTLTISGHVSGGMACTDPIGTNPMKAATTRSATQAAAVHQAEATKRYLQRIEGLSPASERGDEDRAAHENASAIKDATDELAEGEGSGSDALIQIYSPNAMSWQNGTLPDPLIFKQGNGQGQGGRWPGNSAANLVIRIIGVAPEDLEAGKTYQAQSVEASPHGIATSGAPSPYNTLFTSWEGRKHRPGIPANFAAAAPPGVMDMFRESGLAEMAEKAFVFEGTMTQVYASSPLQGTVTIIAVNAGMVIGRFQLGGGQVSKLVTTKKFREDRNGLINGDQIVSQNDTSSGLTVSGTFMAPAIERVYRPGRAIAYTARVREPNENANSED